MKSLKAIAILAVLSVMLLNLGCEKPKQEPLAPEPEVAAPPPSFPRETIPDSHVTTTPPTYEPAPAPGEQPITTIETVEAAPQRKATKTQKAKPKEKYASAKKTSAGGKTYVIKKGDTLQEISQKFYGTTKSWKKIANANKGVIKDPNKLPIGGKIKIP